MKRKQVLTILLALLILFVFVGCDSPSSNVDKNGSQANGQATPSPEPTISPEEAAALLKQEKTLKQNAYIGFSNLLTGRFNDSINRYESYFGLEENLKKPKNPSSPLSISDYYISSVESALEYASKDPAMDEMDGSVQELVPLVLEAVDLINTIVEYYDMKNYVDDDYENGIQYHTTLVSLYSQIAPLMNDFTQHVAEMDRQTKIENMEALKEAGQMVHYYTLESMLLAEDIINYLFANEINDSNIHKVSIDEFQPYYDAFAESSTNFMNACNEGVDPILEASLFDMFKSEMTKLKRESTSMLERIKNSKKASSSYDNGIPSVFVNTYNDVVVNYNRLS